jgi:hypothetical protein
MPAPADRFTDFAAKLGNRFAGPVGDFLLKTISNGTSKTLEGFEPSIINMSKETVQLLLKNPDTPPEMKRLLEKSLEEGDVFAVIVGWILSVIGLVFAVFSIGKPMGNVLNHAQELALRSQIFNYPEAITAWRREPEKYGKFLEDLKYFGWDDDRIEVLKTITQYMPSPQQVIAWIAHEVFEPDMISKYGLDDEFENLDLTIPRKIGMTDEMSKNEWRNHWQHASWNQVVEMVRRGQLEEKDVWDWFRLVEIPPYWRDKLIAISWEVPTRVDVRRFWDMRTIDEARLREIYTSLGYHGKDLDDYVLWTKIYVDFPDLITRFKNGWLTLDEVRSELIGLGMSPERADELIQTKVKAAASEKLAKDKDLTMSQIVKGVKKAVITRDEGSQLLMDMGYDAYEALFILAIEIPQDEVVTEVKVRELTKADILNGLKAGIITESDALAKLLSLRYLPDDAQFILDIYKAAVNPPTETRQKEVTKADIVSAVKKGLITPEDAYLMLQDIGYSPEASEFILMVAVEESPFSPMSFGEFKSITNKWRDIVTPAGKTESEELKRLADQVVSQTDAVNKIQEDLRSRLAGVIDEDTLSAEERDKINRIRTTLYRAQAELERIKTEYQRQLALWKQQATK